MSRNIKSISLLAWLWFGIILVLTLASTAKDLGRSEFEWGFIAVLKYIAIMFASLSFPFVGALIISRQPQNTIGWLLMLPSLGIPLDLFTRSQISGVTIPPANPSIFFLLAAYLSNVLWLFFVSPVFFIALLFPTGRPLSLHWRWVVAFAIGVFSFFFGMAFLSNPITPDTSTYGVDLSIANPVGFLTPSTIESLFPFWVAGVFLLALLCVISIILRYRRATLVERKQITWLIYVVGLFVAFYAVTLPFYFSGLGLDLWNLLFDLFILAIPLAIGMAIFRYRLYDIDLIIRKTLQYTLVSGLLVLTYFGGILVIQGILGPLTGDTNSPLVTVITTLGIAALFNPLRYRVQDFIDRRFYRKKYDAEQSLTRFAATARDEVDMDMLAGALLGVIEETMQPEDVSFWMVPQPEKRKTL